MRASVITINLNNAVGMEATIQSVIEQTGVVIEYIVIDGGSTDGSQDILEKYRSYLSYLISEPDNGVYNAQNKGLKQVSNSHVLFLNSGDRLANAYALRALCDAVTSKHTLVYGDLLIEQTDGSSWLKTYPDKIAADYFFSDTLPHPASLIPTTLLRRLGGYDEHLRICSDWKFFREIYYRKIAKFVHISQPISIFAADGLSTRFESLIHSERTMVQQEYPVVKLQKKAWRKWLRI